MGTTSKRIRHKSTKTCFDRIKTAFQSSQKSKKGLTCGAIVSLVDCFPNFLGCFAQDTLDQSFIRFPVTFLVNVDSFSQKGSHWLAIGLFEKSAPNSKCRGQELLAEESPKARQSSQTLIPEFVDLSFEFVV